MIRRVLLLVMILVAAASPALAQGPTTTAPGPVVPPAPGLPQARLALTLPSEVPIAPTIDVTGTTDTAGRLVVIVRTDAGRVLGRVLSARVPQGPFRLRLTLADVTRPGGAVAMAILTDRTISRTEVEQRFTITPTDPNFQLALPTTWPVGSPIPLTGSITFAGRMVVVVRTLTGRVLGRVVIRLPRPGGFRTFIRLDPAARPGPIQVRAALSAGSVKVDGTATLRLMPTGPNFQLALPTTIRAGQAIPISGRVAFPGRMLVVVRAANGRVLGKQVVVVARPGSFRAILRITPAARPGPATVTASLSSGTLKAGGQAALILT